MLPGILLPVWEGRGGPEPRAPGQCWSFGPLRLDEDGKVLTPEELLYRVSVATLPA